MKRQNMSHREGEEHMQRTHSLVLGLIAVFVLGSSLVLLGCGGGDDTTDINASNAAAQLGGKQFTFTSETDFGVTVSATLAFNAAATRFALLAGNSRAGGAVTYGSCIFTVDASNFVGGTGPQMGLVVTVGTCQTDQSNNNNLILNNATSTSNGPVTVTVN
jgi:hypothetical protein